MSYGGFNQYNSGSGANDYSYGGGSNMDAKPSFTPNQSGGWMNSTSGGGDDDNKTRGGYKNQTLRPVTIKQLTDVTPVKDDSPIMIDNEEIKQVTFIGVVRSFSRQQVNLNYSVEDGTGKIDVRVWSSEDEPEDIDPGVMEGRYVRVYGDLKFFNGKRHVSAHKVRPVVDHNEIAYHGMEAIYVHLTKTRGVAPGLQKNSAAAAAGITAQSAYAPAGGNAFGQIGGGVSGVTPAQAAVLEAMKITPCGHEGMSVVAINNLLANRFSPDQIQSAMQWLIGEGHLYNTIDDNHVQTTNMM
ncbi:Replication factor A protein 2 [Kickxella alabastrina]|uniref:Replication factor A protein 2 n=1 Tax=Kickxella alabastrina TaxID=61397 RepID=A0ACC1I9L0_9FUNG|nr:Replication factor A protein 2 [Kickxella alabastrina]